MTEPITLKKRAYYEKSHKKAVLKPLAYMLIPTGDWKKSLRIYQLNRQKLLVLF